MSMQLRATEQQLADLKQISDLGADKLNGVLEGLNNLEKPVIHPQELLNVIAALLKADAEPLVRQLLSLHRLIRQSRLTVDELITGIREVIEQQGEAIGIALAGWKPIETVIKELVQDQSIRLVAKAVELTYDYANLLRKTKILTDIRPLFNEAANDIEGAVVSYTMRLWYSSADGEHELSIALDESDIKTLAEECARAINKADAARKLMVGNCNLSVSVSGEVNNV